MEFQSQDVVHVPKSSQSSGRVRFIAKWRGSCNKSTITEAGGFQMGGQQSPWNKWCPNRVLRIGRLSHDQQDGQKVHANSKRCGRVAWYHWTILCLSGEAGTTQLKWTWVVPLGVGPGYSLNVSDASCWWLVAGHRHLGSSESLQGLGEQTYSTWPGSVLSLYVNFLRRNQMTVFLLLLLLFLPISKDSEVEQFYTKEFHEVDS